MPKDYKIREATEADAEIINFVHIQTWKTNYIGIIDQEFLENIDLEKRLEFRKKILKDKSGIYLVATFQDKIIGFCDSGPIRFSENKNLSQEEWDKYKDYGEIYAIYLLQEHQGKGIGKALFQSTRLNLKKHGLDPFLVWVLKANKQARTFYEKEGGSELQEAILNIAGINHNCIAYRFE